MTNQTTEKTVALQFMEMVSAAKQLSKLTGDSLEVTIELMVQSAIEYRYRPSELDSISYCLEEITDGIYLTIEDEKSDYEN